MPKFSGVSSQDAEVRSTVTARKYKPYTPIRRRWIDLLKPAIALGKRARSHSTAAGYSGGLNKSASCVALQTDDPAADAVVITALPTVPFCCHADLLSMTHSSLRVVIQKLNARLPAALQIDASPTRSDTEMRTDIEVLVGIRPAMPMAPKAVKCQPFDTDCPLEARSPPISPLANRSKSMDIYGAIGSPRLERLTEEEEPMVLDPPRIKRRKLSNEQESPTPKPRPQAMRRAQSHGGNRTSMAPARKPVQRSVSVDLPDGRTRTIDTAFITTSRPRYQFRFDHRISSTSTPKKNVRGGKRKSTDAQPTKDAVDDEVVAGIDGISFQESTSDMSIE